MTYEPSATGNRAVARRGVGHFGKARQEDGRSARGPPSYRPARRAAFQTKNPKPEDIFPLACNRRTIYTPISRGGRFASDDILRLFDFPDPRISSGQRNVTTVPQQNLFALNSNFMIEPAKELALRLLTEFDNDEARLDGAFSLAFRRPPTTVEQELALEFIHAPTLQTPQLGLSRWEQYARVLLSSNEVLYIE